MTNHKLVILHGNAHPVLANQIAQQLNTTVGNVMVSKFANSETHVIINESVRDVDLYIVQPTCNPSVNDYLMELLVMVDGAKRASAHRITAVIPFFGYARQTKKDKSRSPITCKLVANIIECAGIDRVIAIDLHSSQIQSFFDIPVECITMDNLFVKYIKKKILANNNNNNHNNNHNNNYLSPITATINSPIITTNNNNNNNNNTPIGVNEIVIVSPGVGGVKRAKIIADRLEAELAIIHKANIASSDSETILVGDVNNKVAIIIDDIADTCTTLNSATVTLTRRGASKIYALVTHGVFSNNAIDIINECNLAELVVTDSIPNQHNAEKCPKLKILSTANILAETIRRTHHGESITPINN